MGTATVRAIPSRRLSLERIAVRLLREVRDFLLVYVDADLPAESACPGGALSKGYHLFHRIEVEAPPCDTPPDNPACRGPWPFAEVPISTPLTLADRGPLTQRDSAGRSDAGALAQRPLEDRGVTDD